MAIEEAAYAALFKMGLSGLKNGLTRFFKKKPLSIEEIKKRAQVLFIDDESFDALLTNIRQAGWNVKQQKDIDNFDAENLKNADIIFVDFKGVGAILSPKEEGIGLMKHLKHKYPEKHIIFYSGYAGVLPGYEVHDIADGWIQKNADAYVYIEHIETAARKLYAGKR